MKTTVTGTLMEKSGNLSTSDAQVMGIHAEGMAAILSVLSNMYTDGNLAVVREYACNARDSHVEAGNPDPILVSLPSRLVPQLRVQDFGVGLSKQGILEVYAQYGASTKRNTNDQIGAFGIGAKSAFTVGNQFLVTGVKDGERTVALFAIDGSGSPTVQILIEEITDEPNGVLVEIGVDNIEAVRSAANRLFFAWPKGTVLVNGVEPNSMWDKVEAISDELYVAIEDLYTDSRINVIMGGIPYRLPQALVSTLTYDAQRFVSNAQQSRVTYFLDAPIGSMDIAPNREELRVTPHTTRTLQRLIDSLRVEMPKWVSKQIDSAPSLWQAAKAYRLLSQRLRYEAEEGLKWKGRDLGQLHMTLPFRNFHLFRKRYYGIENVYADSELPVSVLEENLTQNFVVTGVPTDKVTTVRRYVKVFLKENTHLKRLVISHTKSYSNGWFSFGEGSDSDIPYMTYEDFRVKGLELMRAANPNGMRSKTTYNVVGDENMTAEELVATGEEIVLVTRETTGRFNMHNPVIRAALKDKLIVELDGRKKEETFLSRVEGATVTPWISVVDAYAKEQFANLSGKDRSIIEAAQFVRREAQNVITWFSKHRDEITNTAVHDYLDATAQMKLLNTKEQKRLQELEHLYNWLRKPIFNNDGARDDFGAVYFPLLASSVDNMRYSHGIPNLNNALIEYVNNTVVNL